MQFKSNKEAKEYLESFCSNSDYFKYKDVSKIVDLQAGFHNFIFTIHVGSKTYIGKLSKKGEDNNLDKEYKALKFLKDQEINNVPRALAYKNNTVLIMSFLGEDVTKFDNSIITKFAEILAQIHSIPVEKYNEHYKTDFSSETHEGHMLQENYNKYTKSTYKKYCELAENIDQDVKDLYQLGSIYVKERIKLNRKVAFTCIHGDLNIGSLRLVNDQIGLIDWEKFRVGGQVGELAYVIAENKLDKKQSQIFLTVYSQHLSKKLEIDYDELFHHVKYSYLNHMLWAALRYAHETKVDGDKIQFYKEMFLRRLARTRIAWV